MVETLEREEEQDLHLDYMPEAPKPFQTAAQWCYQYRWIILIGLVLASIMEVLDTTIINVALPQMAGNLGSTTEEIAWVSTAYILANVVVLPMTAFLTARFGRRNYLTASIVLFTVASFFCGTSANLGEMVVFRLLQGAGGAALLSTAQAALVQIFPPEEQAVVQPAFLLGLVVAPTVGPTLGGFITDALTWNWCFFINVPIGIITGILIFTFLRDTEPARPDTIVDFPGIALLTVSLGGLQYVLEEGERNDWFADPSITHIAMIAGVAFVALIGWLLSPRNKRPVVNLHVLRNTSLTAGIILFIAVGFGLYGVNYLYPLLAQQLQGLTPAMSGLTLLPGGIASAVSIVFCGVVSSNPKSKLDPRALTLFGLLLSIWAMWHLSSLSSVSGPPDTFWPLLIRGLSLGFLFIPVNSLSVSSLSHDDVQEGVSLLGLARQLGGSIGTAMLATFFVSRNHINRANLVSYVASQRPIYEQTLSQYTGVLSTHGYSAPVAKQGALQIIDQMLTTQAAAISFNQTFLLLMVVSICMIPLLLLMRKARAGSPPVAMH